MSSSIAQIAVRELAPVSLYFHWPHCKSICHYCSFPRVKQPDAFASDPNADEPMQKAYNKLLNDFLVRLQQQNLPGDGAKKRYIDTVFFGGGTPSLADPKLFASIINAVHRYNESVGMTGHSVEISMEANPTSTEAANLQQFHAAGVNRLSIGLQSLHDDELQWLGRTHSSTEALKAVETASSIFGPQKLSVDLMFGLPQHAKEPKRWNATLQRALELGTNHISLYQLTMERNSKFYKAWQNKEFELPDDELSAKLFEETRDATASHGLEQYEVSNYAKVGSECRHNLAYWRYRDYYGIGPGAHSRLMDAATGEKHAFVQQPNIDTWLRNVLEQNQDGNAKQEIIPSEERIEELFLMSLRTCKEGVSENRLRFHAGRPELTFETLINRNVLKQLTQGGFIEIVSESGENGAVAAACDRYLRATRKGMLLLDELLPALLD